MTNLEWLNSFHFIEDRMWQHERVIRLHEVDNFDFYDSCNTYAGLIDTHQIKGIEYAYAYNFYDNINWLELLERLKNFEYIRNGVGIHPPLNSYESLVKHIKSPRSEKGTKSVSKFGNSYITTEGQHRMALAKFLELSEVEVTIMNYTFNIERYKRYSIRIECVKRLLETGFVNDYFYRYALENKAHTESFFLSIGDQTIFINDSFLEQVTDLLIKTRDNFFTILKNQFKDKTTADSRIEIYTDEQFEKYKPFLKRLAHKNNDVRKADTVFIN